MSVFIARFIKFVLFLIVAYHVLFFVFSFIIPQKLTVNVGPRKVVTNRYQFKLEEVKDYGPVDLLVLGSSHAYRGFDPRIFENYGVRMFNLGASSHTPVQAEVLLKRHVELLNPKHVLLEVSCQSVCSDGVEGGAVQIRNAQLNFDFVLMSIELRSLKLYNTILDQMFFGGWSTTIEPQKDSNYIAGGFTETLNQINSDMVVPNDVSEINETQVEAIKRIVVFCNERDIKLTLIQAPTTRVFYNSFKAYNKFDEAMKSIATYYNFNNIDFNLNDTLDFFDADHLNQNGVEKFNRSLLQHVNF